MFCASNSFRSIFIARTSLPGLHVLRCSLHGKLSNNNNNERECATKAKDDSLRRFINMRQQFVPWRILRLNHIAIATEHSEVASQFFRDCFHLTPSDKCAQPDHGVNTTFIDVSNTKLELLDPLDESSPINNFLKRNKQGGIHHLCFEVDNIEAACEDLKKQNIRLLSDSPKTGAHGKPVIFIHPKDCFGLLVELEQV